MFILRRGASKADCQVQCLKTSRIEPRASRKLQKLDIRKDKLYLNLKIQILYSEVGRTTYPKRKKIQPHKS